MAKKVQHKENLELKVNELQKKYGDVKVGVVEVTPALMSRLPSNGYIKKADLMVIHELSPDGKFHIGRPIVSYINSNLRYEPRWSVETDETYLQPICYTVIKNIATNMYYCTKRLNGGDDRLVGARSIGIGGHIDDGEDVYQSMYRELKEEVGLVAGNIFTNKHMGVLYSNKTAVNRVHVGLIFLCLVRTDDIKSTEPDRLEGEWVTKEQLQEYYDKGELESWSELIFQNLDT